MKFAFITHHTHYPNGRRRSYYKLDDKRPTYREQHMMSEWCTIHQLGKNSFRVEHFYRHNHPRVRTSKKFTTWKAAKSGAIIAFRNRGFF